MNEKEQLENTGVKQKSGWEDVAALADKMGQLGINPEDLKTESLGDFSEKIGVSRVAISGFFRKQSERFIEENGEGVENPFKLLSAGRGKNGGRGHILVINQEQQQYYLQEKIDYLLAVQERLQRLESETNLEFAPEEYKTQMELAREEKMSTESVKHFFRNYDLPLYRMPGTNSPAYYLSPAQQAEYREFQNRKRFAKEGGELTISKLSKELGGVKRRLMDHALGKFSDYIYEGTEREKIGNNLYFTPEQYTRYKEKMIEYMNDKRRANYPESAMSYYLDSVGIRHERTYCPDWMKNESTGHNFEIDLYLPDYNLGVEYDGPHHKEKLEHDFEKDQMALERHGTRIFHIREPGLPEMKEGMLGVDREGYSKTALSEAITGVFAMMGIDIPQGVDVKRDAEGIDRVMEERLHYLNFGSNEALSAADNVVSDIRVAS